MPITTRLPQFLFSPVPITFHLPNTAKERRQKQTTVSADFFFFRFLYLLMPITTHFKLPQFSFSPMPVTFHLLNIANERRR